MIPNVKNDLIPVCDKGHGRMVPAELVNEFNDRSAAARCKEPLCNRVYTPSNGYRDLVGDGKHPPTDRNEMDPRCPQHCYFWMYADEQAISGELHYACPAEGCAQTKTAPPKVDAASA
jgi:hypothetical protein